MSARPHTLTEHDIEQWIAAISSGQYPVGAKLPAGKALTHRCSG
jgi:DNA-binding FadR family transcriptional regulator